MEVLKGNSVFARDSFPTSDGVQHISITAGFSAL